MSHALPKHDCPPCPECGAGVGSPAATSERHGVVHWNHLYCPACGHDWHEDDVKLVLQAYWSRGAYDGESHEWTWDRIRERIA